MVLRNIKKAQGIPINVLIIAVVALIVLIVVIGIFTGKIRGVGIGLESCENKGGRCYSDADLSPYDGECPPGTSRIMGVGGCPKKKQNCCVSVLENA